MSISAIATLNAAKTANAPKSAAPAAEPAPTTGDTVVIRGVEGAQPSVAERLLDSNTVAQLVGSKMKAGESVTINANGQTVLEIKKDSVSTYDKFKTFASDTFHAAAYQVSDIVAQDPAFAFKESALGVKSQVMNGIPQDLQDFAEKGFLPMIRVVALALDTKKAIDTFKNPSANHIDKFVDGAHLVTDVAGLGGAVAYAIPSVGASVATALTVAGLMGDVAAYGYHVMKYFADRGMAPPDPNAPPDGGYPTDPTEPDPTQPDPTQPDPTQPTDPSQPPDGSYPDPSQPPGGAKPVPPTGGTQPSQKARA